MAAQTSPWRWGEDNFTGLLNLFFWAAVTCLLIFGLKTISLFQNLPKLPYIVRDGLGMMVVAFIAVIIILSCLVYLMFKPVVHHWSLIIFGILLLVLVATLGLVFPLMPWG